MALDFNTVLSAVHIAHKSGDFEPQRRSNGLLIIPDVDNALSHLVLSLNSFPIPKQGNEVIEAQWQNERRKFAGQQTLDAIEVVYRDYVNRETAALLWAWRNQVYVPPTGAVGLASEYKKDGRVVLFAPNGAAQRVYRLEGVWPSVLDAGDVDMTVSEHMLITVTMQVDRIQPDAEGAAFTETAIAQGWFDAIPSNVPAPLVP